MTEFDSLADQLDAFLGGKKKKRVAEAPNFLFIPPRITIIRSWLSNNTRLPDYEYDHWFEPEPNDWTGVKELPCNIIHNHPYDRPCFTPDFCFEYGYRPPVGEKFSNFFWQKNARYYGLEPVKTPAKERSVLGPVPSSLSTLFNL
jgi:hypothetical protein